MSARLHLLAPEQCIVDQLEQHLLDYGLADLRQTMLVVPTQRLGTALLVRLLRTRPALIPPEILTLEALLRRAVSAPQRIAHDATIDLILRQRLEEHPYRHLRLGHERELRLLYGELYDHGLRTEGITRLLTTITEDIYKNDQHLGSLYDRAEEMAAILDFLDDRLATLGLVPRPAYLSQCASELNATWPELSESCQHVHLIGFTSMATNWQKALPSFAADERVDIWMSEAPRLYHPTSPLKELIQNIAGLGVALEATPTLPRPRGNFECLVAQNVREEVEWAYALAQKAMNQGFPPHAIGVLVTDEGLYGTAVRSVFDQGAYPCNLAIPQRWGGTLAGRHLASLLQFWREKQSLASLLAWIDHPLTAATWDETRLTALRRAILQAGVPQGYEAMRAEIAEAVRDDFDELLAPLLPLRMDEHHPLPLWIQNLENLITTFHYWESFPERDLMQSSQELFEDFVSSLKAFGAGHPLMSGLSFWDLVESHLLAGSIRGTGEPLAGLQVLSLAEARYFPFEFVIILGCHEGCFPKALPQDELLDNYLKKAMGLPGWEVLEAMEDQTFHLLKARLKHLVLLRSARLGEEVLVRSRFTEALMAREHAQEKVLGLPHPLRAADEAPDLATEGVLPAWIDSATSRMSASRLDRLLQCPYNFLLDSLGIHSEATKADESDSRREGEWLHAVLQAFITGHSPRGKVAEPWQPEDEDIEIVAQKALERIGSITDRMVPPDLRESSLVSHLKNHAWPRYIDHLVKRMRAYRSIREFAFGPTHAPVTVEVRGLTRELHGRIDALDFSSQWAFVTDFKRRTVPSLDKSKKGLNAQLPLYALALAQNSPLGRNTPPLVLGYWNIYQGTWTAHGITEEHRPLLLAEGLCSKTTPNNELMIDELLKTWSWREEDVLSRQHFYADPGQCQLCDYAGLCRKDDPRVRDRIAEQDALNQRRGGSFDDPE